MCGDDHRVRLFVEALLPEVGGWAGRLWPVALNRPQSFLAIWGLEDSTPATQIFRDKFP